MRKQVNSVIDISQPAYSQIQRLVGLEIDDNAEDIPEWKKKKESSRRTLKLELSDGITFVDAMEYLPIPHISQEILSPGCKIQLRGPIECRKASKPKSTMLMLKPDNVVVLGGKVDEMAEDHTAFKTLQNHL